MLLARTYRYTSLCHIDIFHYRPAIDRYERAKTKPFIDVATWMAKALGVRLSWLVGNIDEGLDAATLYRLHDIKKLSPKNKELVFEFPDYFISDRKALTTLLSNSNSLTQENRLQNTSISFKRRVIQFNPFCILFNRPAICQDDIQNGVIN